MVSNISLVGAFGAGVLSFLSPCVLPLVPPYLCFLAGVSLDQLGHGHGLLIGERVTDLRR